MQGFQEHLENSLILVRFLFWISMADNIWFKSSILNPEKSMKWFMGLMEKSVYGHT